MQLGSMYGTCTALWASFTHPASCCRSSAGDPCPSEDGLGVYHRTGALAASLTGVLSTSQAAQVASALHTAGSTLRPHTAATGKVTVAPASLAASSGTGKGSAPHLPATSMTGKGSSSVAWAVGRREPAVSGAEAAVLAAIPPNKHLVHVMSNLKQRTHKVGVYWAGQPACQAGSCLPACLPAC